MKNLFDLTGKTAVITGGGGLLAPKYAEALIEYGCSVLLVDNDVDKAIKNASTLKNKYGEDANITAWHVDVTKKEDIQYICDRLDRIDILINNAALDPKITKTGGLTPESRFETMTYEYWQNGIDAILNGTFLCSQVVGNKMLKQGSGNIINIASDLAIIAPDQRIYENEKLSWEEQNVKPITYSAAKSAVVGMTKYLAVYFAKKNIRVNCLSPTGVYNDHPEDFVEKLSHIIPMGRMCNIDELKAAIVFLCSPNNTYMTGHNLIIDGGKTII